MALCKLRIAILDLRPNKHVLEIPTIRKFFDLKTFLACRVSSFDLHKRENVVKIYKRRDAHA